MKMSGTKPMKNTMRKPSPMKQVGALATVKKGIDTATAAAKKGAAKKAAAKTPAMQLKKSGMGKKC